MVTTDRLIDLAEDYGLRAAGRYLGKFGRYPTGDDTDDFVAGLWPEAWEQLRGRGADENLHDICFESWNSGYLGPNA
jgi:hypothetical protein